MKAVKPMPDIKNGKKKDIQIGKKNDIQTDKKAAIETGIKTVDQTDENSGGAPRAKTDFIVTELKYRETAYLAASLYEGTTLKDLRIERKDTATRIGQIVVGVVENVAANIGGAFVRIGPHERAFLPVRKPHIHGSSRLVVRLTKDAYGSKQCTCTDVLEIAGEYCVVTESKGGLAFSSKLGDEVRADLKEKLTGQLDKTLYENLRILIRTKAADCPLKVLVEEIESLCHKMSDIRKRASDVSAYTVLYQPMPFYQRMLVDMKVRPDRVRSDIPIAAQLMNGEVYRDSTLSLAALKGLDKDFEKLTSRKVWLKSGGFLIIDRTEALFAIDVNTGKCERGKSSAETYRRVNFEALTEIVRQIKLRNLNGMILVDFLKMTDSADEQALLREAKYLFKDDAYHADALDITKLGLMEIVREKREPCLEDILKM